MGLFDLFFGSEDEYDQYSKEMDKQVNDDLKEIHASLDTDDDPWTSCGDSNCAGDDD